MRRMLLWGVAATALAGCTEEPSAPAEALYDCVFGDASGIEVGGVTMAEGATARTLCLAAGAQDTEFVFIPFLARATEGADLDVVVRGGGFVPDVSAPTAAVAPAAFTRGQLLDRPLVPTPDERFHREFLRRAARELTPRIGAPAPGRTTEPGTAFDPRDALTPAATPAVGDLISLNVATRCDAVDIRTGRVGAVTDRAILVVDTENPAPGFDASDLSFMGETFDTLIDPVAVRNFGEPSDVDDNDRVIIFFSRAINELNASGAQSVVLGFFWNGDLFPRTDQGRLGGCPGSNFAEMFYLLAPDPTGEINGNAVSVELLRRITVGTIAHEYQHLINAARRLYANNANQFEDVWLNEGLSHISEELVFYAAAGLEPRSNLDVEALRADERYVDAFNEYALQNFARYHTYLEEPDSASVLGEDASLETRGAVWAFLRYAADRMGGDDAALFSALVNTNAAGVTNLRAALDGDPLDWMHDWAVSVYADDAVAVEPRFTQPSWNFRSILSELYGGEPFPLVARPLPAGARTVITLRGGTAAYRMFGILAGQRAALTVTVDDAPPPATLRGMVLRVR